MTFTEGRKSHPIFRLWSAITCIAGALEQRVWIRSQGESIYPNLFTLLIGPAGSGKSRALRQADGFWNSLKEHKVAPISLTKASLMDTLAEAERKILTPAGKMDIFHSLKIAAGELGALIPGYDSDFMNALTYIYDGDRYSERRRSTKSEITIDRPQINLLAAATPGYLAEHLPAGAWDQGFLARVFIIYGSAIENEELDLAEERAPIDTSLRAALITDLAKIGAVYGKMAFTRPTIELIREWASKGGPPLPDHPRLQHYNTRRTVHLLKLCMIAAADRGSLGIDVEDYQRAQSWLFEAEFYMPDMFKSMTSGGDSRVIEECWHFVLSLYLKRNRKPVGDPVVSEFLRQRLPIHAVRPAIELMKRGGLLKEEGSPQGVLYTPQARL